MEWLVCIYRRRRADYEQWVFGMVDTSQIPSLGFMQMVDTRDAATLLPIIRAHTAPGTIIHSDEWANHHPLWWMGCIQQNIPGYPTSTACHGQPLCGVFVNRTNSVHTQNIERYWNRVKKKFKTMKGMHRDHSTAIQPSTHGSLQILDSVTHVCTQRYVCSWLS